MKATVNIGLRIVLLEYKIKTKDLAPLSQNERNKEFDHWELYYNKANTRIVCKHTISFDDADEWNTKLTVLFKYFSQKNSDYENK